MKPYNSSNYAAVAAELLEILEDEPKFVPTMEFFASIGGESVRVSLMEEPECGTAYCLAGKLAQSRGFPEEYFDNGHFNFFRFSIEAIRLRSRELPWYFLFSSTWPGTRESAIKRLRYVVEHKAYPHPKLWREFN